MNEISTAVAGDNRAVEVHVAALVAGSVAENTRRAYGTSLARIDAWADGRPLDDRAIAWATLPELQAVGRWADPAMPGRYCRAQSAGRSAVARLRGD